MKRLSIIFIVSLLTIQLFPQDTLTKKEIRKTKCNFLLTDRVWTAELPIWVPGFAGEFAYGEVEIEGEDGMNPVNPIEPPESIIGQIFSRLFNANWYLRFFFITRVAYEKNNYLIQFDAITANIGNTVKWTTNQKESNLVAAYFRGSYGRLMFGYKLIETTSQSRKFRYELFGYTGVRFYYYSAKAEFEDSNLSFDISPLFADPLLGLQSQCTWKRWMIFVQGDIGGIFIKDKESLQLSFYTYYRLGKLNSLKIGWNHLYINQAGYFKNERFQLKTTMSGPSLGLAFHF